MGVGREQCPKYISGISVVNPGGVLRLFTLYPGIRDLFELEGQREARAGLCPPPARKSWGGGAEPAEKIEVGETCLQSICLIDLPGVQLLACF